MHPRLVAESHAIHAEWWPFLCGAELLIQRFRAECFQLEEPEFELADCPAIGVGGYHSESYAEQGEWHCDWCGARPFWPITRCSLWSNQIAAEWPHPCTRWPRCETVARYELCCWEGAS